MAWHAVLQRDGVQFSAMLRHNARRCATLRDVVRCRNPSRGIVSCHVMSCHVASRRAYHAVNAASRCVALRGA
eukprot:2069790-Lingulodinium_polyedra.AAC.1